MKCGPDDCPIVAFSDLTPAEQRVERKRIAEKMSAQGFTQEHIAKTIGVSHQTIGRDLEDFNLSTVDKSKPTKTASNPKGAGRPKGSKPKQPEVKAKHEKIVAFADKGMPSGEIAGAVGISQRMVDRVLEVENARREAEPEISPDDLSLSAQEKLAMAIRQHQRKLDLQFEQCVLDEIRRRMDEIILPEWKQRIEQAKELYSKRKALMDKALFNLIRRALHPDSRHSISDKKLAEAFDAFMSLEKYLLDEKDSPTTFGDLPSSAAEWEKMRAARKSTKRNSQSNIERRA